MNLDEEEAYRDLKFQKNAVLHKRWVVRVFDVE
jgi:hypothetical protein